MPCRDSRACPGFRTAALVLLAVGLGPGPLVGQERTVRVVPRPHHPLVVVVRSDLTFGRIFRGTPSVVSPNDHRAAQFDIEAGRDAQLQVSFVLPAALVSRAAELLSLQFGPGNGIAIRVADRAAQLFDPTAPFTTTIGRDDRLLLRLGGTALPGARQSLGEYHGTVTVIVADLGT